MKRNEQAMNEEELLQADFLLRQKRFALVLCGDEAVATKLVRGAGEIREDFEGQPLSASARQFFHFKKLYELWTRETQRTSTQARLFQPGHENEAIQKGLDPAIASAMGELPSLHRALLVLIYGEEFSYAASAQLLGISIEELMIALAAARRTFARQAGEQAPQLVPTSNRETIPWREERAQEVVYDAAC